MANPVTPDGQDTIAGTKVKVAWETDGESLKSCGLKRTVVIPSSVLAEVTADALDAEEGSIWLDYQSNVIIPAEDVIDGIGDWLSDEFGFLHNGWEVVGSC